VFESKRLFSGLLNRGFAIRRWGGTFDRSSTFDRGRAFDRSTFNRGGALDRSSTFNWGGALNRSTFNWGGGFDRGRFRRGGSGLAAADGEQSQARQGRQREQLLHGLNPRK
jgi:hypothetical protein